MLTHSELDRIARMSAAQAAKWSREDAYQEAWLRFIQYPPPCKLYAWRAANSARIKIGRDEQRFWRVKQLDASLFDHSPGVLVPYRRRPRRRLADPNGTKYWRKPEQYRASARLRMRRWRASHQ